MEIKLFNQHYDCYNIEYIETFWGKKLVFRIKVTDIFFDNVKIGTKIPILGREYKIVRMRSLIAFEDDEDKNIVILELTLK